MTANSPPGLGRGLTIAMAFATGVAVANIYYNQPMLGVMERDFAASSGIAMIPTATQVGYACGLLFLVPLGDLVDQRRLIVTQFIALAAALAACALAPTAAALIAASVLIGAGSAVAQQILPFAAALAPAERRGRVVGAVMSGLLCGILLSRTLAGFVATHLGWRQMFWLSVPLALSAALLMALCLPFKHPHADVPYREALKSLAYLWRAEPALRRAARTQAALFASFSAFWTILALHLEEPAFRLGADVAGLFGIVGAFGVLAAPVAGRIADRHGPHRTIFAGAVLALVSWLLFEGWRTLSGLAVGVILLDLGVQSALVSHQHIIYALRPEARNRLNTIFVTGMFIGGSIGSALATLAWRLGGWTGVGVCGILAALFALGSAHRPRRQLNRL